ncbi:MAG: Fic family protein [Phycisphaerales bacterium]|nr:MAG: Fic family protein [Phycisphaerales bacterium]
MDITNFTEFKTGQLEPITTETGNNWAFVPDRLTSFEPTTELWHLIGTARDCVARLEQIKGILSDPFLLLRPLQQREAHRSSRLEGTIALPEDLLFFDVAQDERETAAPSQSHRQNESREVWNHYEALRQGHNWIADGKPLGKSLIQHLHKILMTGVRGKDKNPGEFRDRLVAVGARPRLFIPPPPDRIDGCITQLDEYMASDASREEPLSRCCAVHYQFEAIHPFQDGNGRVGRVLLSLCISKWLKLTLPWLYLSEFFERNRREYTERMFRISTNGEWGEWIAFCLQGAIEQSLSTLWRCESLKTLREKYIDEYAGLGNRMREILEMLFESPVVSNSHIARRCSVSNETARKDLLKLVEVGVLHKSKRGRPKTFACLDIIEVAFGDSPLVAPFPS